MHVEGTERFRVVALFGSLIASAVGCVLILVEPRRCLQVKLERGVYLSLSVHLSVFVMLLVHYIHLGICFKKIGKLMYVYYAYLVIAMVLVQQYLLRAQNCNLTSPLLYYYLALNTLLFYVFVAYGLSLWGAYLCWE